jgi:hypothetical protein
VLLSAKGDGEGHQEVVSLLRCPWAERSAGFVCLACLPLGASGAYAGFGVGGESADLVVHVRQMFNQLLGYSWPSGEEPLPSR